MGKRKESKMGKEKKDKKLSSKSLTVIKTGKNGLLVHCHFTVEGYGRCEIPAHYTGLEEPVRDFMYEKFKPWVKRFGDNEEVSPELFRDFFAFLDELTGELIDMLTVKE